MTYNYNKKYESIINRPHHVSKVHPQMSLYERSAQFAPFAALTGYEEEIKETERETQKKIEIDDEQKSILDGKIQMLIESKKNENKISVTFFEKDKTKRGGKYITISGIFKKINLYNQTIVFTDNTEIPIKNIIDIKLK